MYCAIADIEGAIGQGNLTMLSNDSGEGSVNIELVEDIINSVSGIMDGYIRNRYDLPLKQNHYVLKKACTDLSVYELYKRRGDEENKTRRLAYEDAIDILEKIQKGFISLDEGVTVSENSPQICVKTPSGGVFDKLLVKYRI